MKSSIRYYLIAFVILFSSFFFRYYFTGRGEINRITAELMPNSLIKATLMVTGLPEQAGDYQIFRLGSFRVKTNQKEQFIIGQGLQVIGKPEVRVIRGFDKQIWLINPEIRSLGVEEYTAITGSSLTSYGILSSYGKILKLLVIFRSHCLIVFYQALPYQQAALLSGIVMGTSGQFDSSTWEAMQKTGTLHIVAASGMNVMLLAKVLLDLLVKIVNRKIAYFVSILAIFIYFVLAGASPAVGRAAILASISFLGLFWGRGTSSGWLLLLTGWLMLLFDPGLLFNTGFQLSFTAMAGMIWIKPVFVKKLFNSSLLADTISAQIATFPVIYFTFGQIQVW